MKNLRENQKNLPGHQIGFEWIELARQHITNKHASFGEPVSSAEKRSMENKNKLKKWI